jgi:hypothetical protein
MKAIGSLTVMLLVCATAFVAVAQAGDRYPYHYWTRPWSEAMVVQNQARTVVPGVILDAHCYGVGTMLRSSLGVKTYRDFQCRFIWKSRSSSSLKSGSFGLRVEGKTTFIATLN